MNKMKFGLMGMLFSSGIMYWIYNKKYKDNISLKYNDENRKMKLFLINSHIKDEKIKELENANKDLEIIKMHNYNEINQFFLNDKNKLNIIHNYKNNSIIGINAYGDIEAFTEQRINQIHSLNQLTFFERLTIMNTKDKLFQLNNNDFILLYTTNQKDNEINYEENKFVLFRKIYREIFRNLNLSFYVLIPKYFIKELHSNESFNTNNRIYLISRNNYIHQKLTPKNAKYITIDSEEFVFIDITDEISLSNYMKVLITKGNFYFYIKINQTIKNIIENLNTIFSNIGYYALYGNMLNPNHKMQIINFLEKYKSKLNNKKDSTDCYPLIVIDNMYHKKEEPYLIQTFKDKYFNLMNYTLQNVKFESEIPYHEPKVLKKKILNISNIKWYNDINFEQNDYFNNKY